jgi:sigma-B regulation protein RsbU (phosphoserine phosphatase)
LAVPLFKGDNLIGLLNVEHQQINAFDETDVDVLEAIAGQVAVAIESAASLIEIKELNNLLEQLQKITAEITSETTDHDKVLNQIVTSVGKTLRGVYCAVRLYDPSKQEFGKRFADGVMQEVDDRAPRKGGATNYVVKHKRALYAGTLADVVPESNEPIIRKELAQVGAQAAAYLPLNIKENTVGVLYMFWTTPQSFTGNEKRTLQLFADQTTIAIENARLFKERSQELARTQALSRLGEMLAVIEQQ